MSATAPIEEHTLRSLEQTGFSIADIFERTGPDMLERSFSDARHNLRSAHKGPLPPQKYLLAPLSALPLFGREIRRHAVDLRDPGRCFRVLARLIRRQDLTVQLRP